MAEALDRGDEPEPESEAEQAPAEGVIEESDPSVTDESFDAAAYAAQAWEQAGRIVRPEDRPGDPLVQVLAGGAVAEEALYQMGQKYRRAGWTHTISPSGGWTPVRR